MKAPDILYIDDVPQELLAPAEARGFRNRFVHFEPTENRAAKSGARANLWIFDFFNDDAQRTSPDLDGVSSNGLSVFQQLRLLVGDARPPAILVSNHLEEALGCDVVPARRHILAEQVGVEWIAAKHHTEYDAIDEIVALADGVAALYALRNSLQTSSPVQYPSDLATLALKLPRRARWTPAAVRSFAEWRPPVWIASHEPIGASAVPKRAGLTTRPDIRAVRDVIAWMIRHVLPYPSFLSRDRHIAARLGITLECLRAAIAADTQLSSRLRPMSYTGILKGFAGPRWWTAAIDAFDWELPRDNTGRTSALEKLVAPIPLAELGLVDPVVVSDADLVETDEIDALENCVRASDEYFPAPALPAWVRISAARDEVALARKVRVEDQHELALEAKAP